MITAPDYKDHFCRELARLTALNGVSGHERPVVEYLREQLAPLADTVEVDAMGNLYATRSGGDGPHLMVAAHSDEIGGLVSAIGHDGFLRFQPVGGVPGGMLVGRKVRIRGRLGIVGTPPGHLLSPEQRKRVPDIEEMYIDLGVTGGEEAMALGIRIGDGITWQSELEPTANPDRICGKAIDNRVGCLIVRELLHSLHGQDLPGTLTVVVAVQEEVGLKGAAIAADRVGPDVALVVDTVPSADTPDTGQVHTFPVALGRGPLFQVSSGGAGSGYLMPEPIRDYLVRMAEEAGIDYQLATFSFGNTDAASVFVSAGGIPTAVATIPRRYAHSPVELIDLNDAVGTLRLCQEVVWRVEEFPSGMMG